MWLDRAFFSYWEREPKTCHAHSGTCPRAKYLRNVLCYNLLRTKPNVVRVTRRSDFSNMNKQSRKFQLLAGSIALLMVAMGIGCRGFFVNPTLSTLTVGPTTPTFQQGSTLQMAATGTFNDGTTQDLTNKAFWSTSDSTIASITTTGLVTGVSPGTATITAASGTVSGSTTITIALANITSIAVTPSSSTITGQYDSAISRPRRPWRGAQPKTSHQA